jgi:GDPmannose 4,6-dehydratase
MTKRALITGITGMDGSYMADLLLSKDYEVYGMERHKSSESNYENIKDTLDKIQIVKGDLADYGSIYRALTEVRPDEIYNFAAQSFVGDSWRIAEHTANITGLGVLRLLEAVRNYNSNIKVAQASSSEMFGNHETDVANETTTFQPRSPYGTAKLFAHHTVRNYRESYGMFVASSISFNHESERRGKQFVTRKITSSLARIVTGKQATIKLGSLEPRRDWGYAPDYVEGIWRMLQYDEPTDFVFATGKSYSVKDFVVETFKTAGIEDWQKYVEYDSSMARPAEIYNLKGDYSKARLLLGWEPTVSFQGLVARMFAYDLRKETYE